MDSVSGVSVTNGRDLAGTSECDGFALDFMLYVFAGPHDPDRILESRVPFAIWYAPEHLTGAGLPPGVSRAVEVGLADLRAIAACASFAIAHAGLDAAYARDALGFVDVLEVDPLEDPASVVARIRVAVSGPSVARKLHVQVQGPFDSTYSLAVVNVDLALGLDARTDTVGTLDVVPGDQVAPRQDAMLKRPDVDRLWRRRLDLEAPDAVIRNSYPPRPEGMSARGRFLYFFWEDSRICTEWATRFNEHLTGVLAPSRHVRDVLLRSGVTVPIEVVSCGVETRLPRIHGFASPLSTEKSFKFLHISSAFPRKGVDVLLEAYAQEFSEEEDVALVLKTFPNPHNETDAWIEATRARHPRMAEVVHIHTDLPEHLYYGLYRACDAFVSTTRCEGFGLPMAEAMVYGLPVIVTGYSGHADFCNAETAFIVGTELVQTESHLAVDGSLWAEPSIVDTRAHMRHVFSCRHDASVRDRVGSAFSLIQSFTWENVAARAHDFMQSRMGDA